MKISFFYAKLFTIAVGVLLGSIAATASCDEALMKNSTLLQKHRVATIRAAQKLKITISDKTLQEFEAAVQALRTPQGDLVKLQKIRDRIEELVESVISDPANRDTFKIAPVENRYAYYFGHSLYIIRADTQLPLKTRLALSIAEYAYAKSLYLPQPGLSEATTAYNSYTSLLDDRALLVQAQDMELDHLSRRQIIERQAFIKSELQALRMRFLSQQNLPYKITKFINSVVSQSGPDFDDYNYQAQVDRLELEMQNQSAQPWHFYGLDSFALFLRRSIPQEELRNMLTQRIIQDNEHQFIPTEAMAYMTKLEKQWQIITVILAN